MSNMPLTDFILEYVEAVEDIKEQAKAQKGKNSGYKPPKHYGRKGKRRR